MRKHSPVLLRSVGLLVLLAVVIVFWWVRPRPEPPASATPAQGIDPTTRALAAKLGALQAREKQVEETVWAKELLAQRHGRVFERLWDSLNAASNRLAVCADLAADEIVLPNYAAAETFAHGILLYPPGGAGVRLAGSPWRDFVEGMRRAGWELVQVEFRHNQFQPAAAAAPAQSRFYASAHLINPSRSERAVLQGHLSVTWSPALSGESMPRIRSLDARELVLTTRCGETPFQPILHEEIQPPEGSFFIDPLILHDLDGDGLSEIILAATNQRFRRRGPNRYEPEPLCQQPPGLIFTAVVADFDKDGAADFLCARFDGLVLFKGSRQGTFAEAGRLAWSANPRLRYGQVLTCGDSDRDGDLDVWLGQYKGPYLKGQMPTPYYDANDGYPSHLLMNDGQGSFTEATVASGLGTKRWRRSYSGSFVGVDGDSDLDLLVVSDFAGVDLHLNDGHGRFTDGTQTWFPESHGFGMAHLFTDFNVDGRLDLLVTGMHCPTALRLEALGLRRPGFERRDAMRARMTAGNRLYLGRASDGFELASPTEPIAHSGWSWGCSAADFDNDGFPDVYIANGHESKSTVRDYEPEFWLHDIYVGTSKDDLVASAYFLGKSGETRGKGDSYGGYEKNRLFLNRGGRSFLEVGHLLGVALEQDCRNAVADDLDGDGRPDLLVTTFEAWPQVRQTLRVYRNTLSDVGNWIGFRVGPAANGASPIGTRVTLHYAGGTAARQVVTGESHRSQHAHVLHFGLGPVSRVNRVEFRWPNGCSTVLREPTAGRYHIVRMPGPE